MTTGPYLVRGILGSLLIVAIVAGISELTARARPQSGSRGPGKLESDTIFSSGNQYIPSAFHVGELNTIMGRTEIDLREATMEGNEAALDVAVLMGHAEVRIPETWTVVTHDLSTLMGKTMDNTKHPKLEESSQRFVVRGWVAMGKLEIRN